MKLLLEPIEVQMRDGLPHAMRWRDKVYTIVEVSQCWTYRGKWWTDPTLKGEVRHYFRVRSCAGQCCATAVVPPTHRRASPPNQPRRLGEAVDFELFESDGRWTLSRVMD